MPDIGFQELVLIFIIGLLVLGPERLPTAIRTVSITIGRLRRSFNSIREEIEREVGADEIRADLHNEAVMESLNKTGQQLSDMQTEIRSGAAKAAAEVRELHDELHGPLTDPDKKS